MEDCVDDFMARADTKQDGPKGFKRFFDKVKKLIPSHEIACEIEKLKARAIEASERHKRYKTDRPTPDSPTSEIDPRLHALYVDVGKLVGIEFPKKHIIEWLKNEDSSTQLRVVSIVGPGGLGKTTLANAVFQAIRSEFSCAAFVSVSRKTIMINVLRDIAERLGVDDNTSNDDVRRLTDRLRDHLREKKYLIVIDDIWSTKDWEYIRNALLDNDYGSRIITSTRNSAIASCCSQGDYVYLMKPLGFHDSKRLLLQRAFHSEDLLPPNLEKVSKHILEKCAGLPLAIITISSFLAHKTAEDEWKRVLATIGSSYAKEAGDMSRILSLSYFDLPHPMRTCLLYLSAYPEDHIIEKRSLIHKWIAEGFIHEGQGKSTYELGESYFNDFVNRSLIQPAQLVFTHGQEAQEKYGQVEACRVHDIILDFITCKAKEENFMTSSGDAEQGTKHNVRRLFVPRGNHEMGTVAADLSHVRSLTIFGCCGQNSALGFPSLRVLDLEDCQYLGSNHLANIIEKTFLLKHLRLGLCSTSNDITELLEGIGKLKYLETLDMGGASIRKLPSTMAQLRRLARLYAAFKPTCLSDGIIGQLQSLKELENVTVGSGLDKFLKEVGQLTKLRTLSVTLSYLLVEDAATFIGNLVSSYNIHHLTINTNFRYDTSDLLSLEPWCPANPAVLRKICIPDLYIEKVPSWMTSLVNLRGLDLNMLRTGPEDVMALGGIPALVFLKLRTSYGRNGRISIRGFRSLKYFKLELRYCGTAVDFEEGSMPKLDHLEFKFSAHTMECVNTASDFGIQHLCALTKVDIVIDGKDDILDKICGLIETAVGKLRNHPTLSLHLLKSNRCFHFKTLFTLCYRQLAGSKYQWRRESARCSFYGRVVEEINRDALSCLSVMNETDGQEEQAV